MREVRPHTVDWAGVVAEFRARPAGEEAERATRMPKKRKAAAPPAFTGELLPLGTVVPSSSLPVLPSWVSPLLSVLRCAVGAVRAVRAACLPVLV